MKPNVVLATLPHSPVSTTRFVHRGLLFRKPSFTAAQLSASMSDSSVTVRTKKFITNRLLSRRQFVSNPQRPNASSALCAQMPAQPSDTLHSLRLASLPLQCVCCVCCVCSAPGGWLRHLSLPDAPTVLVIGWNGSMLTRARSRARPCRFAQVVEVIHPGLAGVSKKDLKEKLATMYKVRATPSRLWPVARRQQRQQRREQHQN